jgi:hypothetical protein
MLLLKIEKLALLDVRGFRKLRFLSCVWPLPVNPVHSVQEVGCTKTAEVVLTRRANQSFGR